MTTSHSEVTLREIAVRLTGAAHAVLVGRLRARELAQELRAIAEWIEGGTKPATPAKEEVTTQVEIEIFQYWQARFSKPRARFSPERRKVIRARLRDGYDAAYIRRAIDGCHASPFHNGENDRNTEHNDITLICRNSTKLEQFYQLAGEHATRPLATTANEETQNQIARLTRDGNEALKKGDVNGYNRTQEEIRKLNQRAGDDGRSQGAEAARPRRAAQAG